jgi:hypothetical protein
MRNDDLKHRCTVIFKFFWGGSWGLWENLGESFLCFIAFLWPNFQSLLMGYMRFDWIPKTNILLNWFQGDRSRRTLDAFIVTLRSVFHPLRLRHSLRKLSDRNAFSLEPTRSEGSWKSVEFSRFDQIRLFIPVVWQLSFEIFVSFF